MTHEFRKLMNLFENENPDVEYEYVGDTKSKTLSGDFSKVIAKLSGPTSAKFTKIGNKFKELYDLEKDIEKLKAESTEEARQAMEQLFDSEQAVLTRIAETKSVIMQIAKDTQPKQKRVKDFDLEGFVRDAYDLLGKELYWPLRDIRKAHEKISIAVSAGKKGTFKVTPKKDVKEDVGMGQVDKLVDVVTQMTDLRMQSADRKIDNLKSYTNL